MTYTTWRTHPLSNDYSNPGNWSFGEPGIDETAYFGHSEITEIQIHPPTFAEIDVRNWIFNPPAPSYTFTFDNCVFAFYHGAGIVTNGSAPTLILGDSTILYFFDYSSAANSSIHVGANALVLFENNGTAGNAKLDTDAGAVVDFSFTAGPSGNGRVTAGSIAGGGTYYLGAVQLTIGSVGLSTTVSGPVNDGGDSSFGNTDAVGGSLVKVGPGRLRLSHPHNTYSGGTILEAGAFDVAALGAAGTGAITFAGHATLTIENAALSRHAFGYPIKAFGAHDLIDLAGLHFHPGATATWHPRTHHLTVHSGSVTDTLTLLSPHGTHFGTAGDGHGGTDILIFA